VKAVFLLVVVDVFSMELGNSAQLCQNFRISGWGGVVVEDTHTHPLGTPLLAIYINFFCGIGLLVQQSQQLSQTFTSFRQFILSVSKCY
jgi:hypothetical protein